jgi:head-tail adaptor
MERLEQTGSGRLEQRVAFDRRAMVDDGYGNEVAGDWQEQFQARAQFLFLRGSEQVMAARLASREPMLVRIRMSAAAKEIGNDWQLRDMHGDGKPYNVRDITWDNNRAVIDLLVEGGVATG